VQILSRPLLFSACRTAGLAALLVLAGGVLSLPAMAAVKHRHHGAVHHGAAHRALARFKPMPGSPTDPSKDAALIVDATTGKVLFARNEKAERHPASLTKMMTLYLLFDALKRGQITMQTPMRVSAHAAAQAPTKLYLRAGTTIPVDTAIRSIVIRSANDVAVVIAEALGGTESHFAEMMTQKARQLGMRDTNYHNASGLPDPLQITTASDLVILARHLAYDFPQYFSYFALPGFTYHGVYYPTHDNLIGRYDGADGIKTGYTGGSGFNLATSVERSGVHVIGVVMGGRTAYRRDAEMVRLLNNTFTQIAANPALVAHATVPWQNVAQSLPAPAVAGFAPIPAPRPHGDAIAELAAAGAPGDADDEDVAESRHEPGEDFSVIHADDDAAPVLRPAAPAKPAPVAAKPPVAVAVAVIQPGPTIRPSARPDVSAPSMAAMVTPTRLAMILPRARPGIRTAIHEDMGEGDAGAPGMPVNAVAGRNWTIQIGAYADQNLARAELASYAERSQDVLGQAARIVVPFQSVDGHTLFRARFGLFAEDQAREVCSRLTRRGQTCFAAVATR
jgi:D-alanyl-D-alanine carboxypeptidase